MREKIAAFTKVWDDITNPFPNYNGATVEVWEWISNFIPQFDGYEIIHASKKGQMYLRRGPGKKKFRQLFAWIFLW